MNAETGEPRQHVCSGAAVHSLTDHTVDEDDHQQNGEEITELGQDLEQCEEQSTELRPE